MFEILFGWRKASRCKRLIKRIQCRLKLLKNKRDSIIRQFRQDVVQLIKSGHEDCAFTRIEQLYKDQNLKAVYDLLDSFCEFIIINLPYIRRHRDCPNDINEAVSSLLYASARCGDLPELIKLRKLFSERYGQKFAMTAVELLHGNLVNCQIIQLLYIKSIPDDLKFNLLKEIARENGLQLEYLEVNGEFDLQQHSVPDISTGSCKVEWIEPDSERDVQFIYDGIDGSKLQASYENEIQQISKFNTSITEMKKMEEAPHSYNCSGTKNKSISAMGAVHIASDRVDPSSLNLVPSSANIEKHEDLDTLDEPEIVPLISSCQSDPRRFSLSTGSCVPPQQKVETVTRAPSESPSSLSDRNIVYLDDVEELQPSTKEHVIDKDQRVFKFKSSIPLERKSQAAITNSLPSMNRDLLQPFEPSERKSSSGSASNRKSSRKRLNTRSVLLENLGMKDVECALYYGEPAYSSPDDDLFSLRSYPGKNHQRKMSDTERSTNHTRKLSSPKSPLFFADNNENCDYPCEEALNLTDKATNKEVDEAVVINFQPSSAPSVDSYSRTTSPWTRTAPPYVRAMTMPLERPKGKPSYIPRSTSSLPKEHSRSSIGSPSYVHPKLPDYEDLAARLRAIRNEQLAK